MTIQKVSLVNEERLLRDFLELAKLNGPSGKEQRIADYLVPRLEAMGFSIRFDEAHRQFDGECGNLVAYWEGTDPSVRPMFFSTHMDTVLPTEGLKPEIRDGIIYSDGTTILGADDRAALAAYLEAVQSIQEAGMPCGPIELILTVNEQRGLTGSRHMDYSLIQSKEGYVFDSSGDVGQIILQGPFSSKIYVELNGKSSHIGLNPEEGINAFLIAADVLKQLPLGKISEDTLANIGMIQGGELSSIIPGQVELIGEVRSFTEQGLVDQLNAMKETAERVAQEHGGTANVRFEKKYLGFHVGQETTLGQNAVQAAEDIQVDYYLTRTLGGADTNVLNENGLTCITLGNGFRNIHTFHEHISVQNLINTGIYTVSLIRSWYQTHRNPGAASN
ncbi:peptidase M20 [Brevibacillus choshinensis]|uniref:Peptidase M20 n=1 Tax=Brevibacillus choshinensis TaxID=54911 RepID=A0ABR5N194_BRECH|nr:M20/M25/M40 family metallo-hydrolase [Brevibacillus choshinensis]KQL44272.1 peptidase M20 [Brevibacillus choshinensis]